MQFEPGPLPPIGYPTSQRIGDDYSFSDLVRDELPALPVLEQVMDTFVDPDVFFAEQPDDDGLSGTLDGLSAMLGESFQLPDGSFGQQGDTLILAHEGLAAFSTGSAIADAETQQNVLAEQLVNVYSATPAEAFQAAPDSLGGYDPANPLPTTTIASSKIENLTRPGQMPFWPGDEYKITLQWSPAPGSFEVIADLLISLDVIHDLDVIPQLKVGYTDSQGVVCLRGFWGFDAIGEWQATPYETSPGLQNFAAGESFKWTVAALPDGQPYPANLIGQNQAVGFNPTLCGGTVPIGSSITVTLENTSNPGSDAYKIGDQWTLTVRGLPNATVLISAKQDGTPLPWETLGQTDDTGIFSLSYFMPDDTYIGQWQEFYQVGDVVWSGSLTFSVQAR